MGFRPDTSAAVSGSTVAKKQPITQSPYAIPFETTDSVSTAVDPAYTGTKATVSDGKPGYLQRVGSGFKQVGEAFTAPDEAIEQRYESKLDVPGEGLAWRTLMAGGGLGKALNEAIINPAFKAIAKGGKAVAPAGKGLIELLPEKQEQAVKGLIAPPSDPRFYDVVESLVKTWKATPEGTKRMVEDIGYTADVIPSGYVAKKGAQAANVVQKAVRKPIGDVVEGLGKGTLRGAMKIKDVTAKKAAKNIEKGAKKIVDDIALYGVESATGGFRGMSKKAATEIDKAKSIADDIIEKAVKEKTGTVDVDQVFLEFMDDLQSGNVDAISVDEIERALGITGDIADGIRKYKGISGVVDVGTANEVKKEIAKGAFKKGAPSIADDPLKNKVKELLNLKMRDKIKEIVPEIDVYNRKIHDLINVKLAADEAAKRQGNWSNLRLSDLVIGGSGFGSSVMAGSPETAIGTAALMLSTRALGGGRGPSALISAGKMIKAGTDNTPTRGALRQR